MEVKILESRKCSDDMFVMHVTVGENHEGALYLEEGYLSGYLRYERESEGYHLAVRVIGEERLIRKNKPEHCEIETAGWGDVSADEVGKIIEAYEEAKEVVEAVERFRSIAKSMWKLMGSQEDQQ